MKRRLGVPSCLSVVVVLSSFGLDPAFAEETRLIEGRSEWRYLVSESGPGTEWASATFDDSGWAPGTAQLGYGDGDEETVVGYGGNSSDKFTTTYYRKSFEVADPTLYERLDVALVRDDGAVVYLNGTEVFRSNMPATEITHETFASSAQTGSEEDVFHYAQIDESLLVAGTNVLAVEIHQSSSSSSDTSFDLHLSAGTEPIAVVRGPYLQMGTPTAMTIRWRTDPAGSSRVRYGTDSSLPWHVDDAAVVTEHEVRLVDLEPGTRYFYSVGTIADPLTSTDSPLSFRTGPGPQDDHATRIWVIGDAGTSDLSQATTFEAYRSYNGDRPTDLWLMLGDNAYDDGTDVEFQTAVFEMYEDLLASSVVWPTLGNHDGVAASSATQSGPYYDMFTLPKAGEAGGEASGTEAYYSFDYANIHFICLESFETSRSLGSPMMTWLEDDIAATDADWVIAFWHHPPYTAGSHDSDASLESIEMRENAVPILEEFGVDLVLTGHSHSYERSFLLDGHYDSSGSLLQNMVLDSGDGDENGDGAYTKRTLGSAPHEGAVYVVAGSSGKLAGGPLDHPAMFTSQ